MEAHFSLQEELPEIAVPSVIETPKDLAKYSKGLPIKLHDTIIPTTPKQKALAMARYEVVRQYLTYLAAAEPKQKGAAREEFILRYNSGEQQALFRLFGCLSWKTIEGWKRTLRQSGGDPLALIDSRGGHSKGESKLSEEQATILRTFAWHPNKLRISTAIKMAKKVMASQGIDTVSDATCRRYITKLKTERYPEWFFYREGEQALENECSYTIERDWSKLEVGDMLTADGHVLNFEVINPATGKPCRL